MSRPSLDPSGHRERLGVLVRDPVVRADIDYDRAAVEQPGEVVRRMAPHRVPACPYSQNGWDENATTSRSKSSRIT